jgi:hypothetical protein
MRCLGNENAKLKKHLAEQMAVAAVVKELLPRTW